MIKNDRQYGKPFIQYTDTKINIEALAGLTEGSTAYATDTNQFGAYNGAAWTWYDAVGQYRQFVYIVSGGDFSFVIDGDGEPVMVLQDLE